MSGIKSIDPLTLQDWLSSGEALIIDVREPMEYQVAHIPMTRNIPLLQLQMDICDLIPEKNKKIVMVCKAGIRSMIACQSLSQAEPPLDSWNLTGGIDRWEAQGLPLIKGS